MPVLLVLVLLSRDPATAGFGIGLHGVESAQHARLRDRFLAALLGLATRRKVDHVLHELRQ
jgi:hypothetical protein